MSSIQIHKSGSAGVALTRLLSDEGAIRRLSVRSGLSTATLRAIANTGIIDSYVSAIALERATDGAIRADEVTSDGTKGAALYRREPARSLLLKAFDEGLTVARLLARFELTSGDLWSFMNAPAGKCEDTKRKVREALLSLNLSTVREEPK